MTEILLEDGPIIMLGAISKEEDLKHPARIVINGPPRDGRCNVCGRHISELEPFGGPGDPLVRDFSGECLVKTWRPINPHSSEPAERARIDAKEEVSNYGKHYYIPKYGEETMQGEFHYVWQMYIAIRPSWECRDCIGLSEDEYFEAVDKRSKDQEQIDGRIGCSGEDD